MKNITLDKLRTLAAAVVDSKQGSKARDAATDALNAKFSPRCLVKLIEQLEAAQRERDELKEQVNTVNARLTASKAVKELFKERAWTAEEELQRRNAQEPVAWTDEQELRDVEKNGCGYLFTANPVTPRADPRRIITLYVAASAALPEKVMSLPELCMGVVQSGKAVMVPYKGGH